MGINLKRLTAVARGHQPADLILKHAEIVNVFNGEIEPGNIAIVDGIIAGIGDYQQAQKIIDIDRGYVLPGLINGHVHIESSMLDVGQYARAVVPRGTTALVTDLHEIANVCGMEGINYVMEQAKRLPFDLFLMAPSCVPATHLETSGATLSAKEIKQLLHLKRCRGLGEMMNYPDVLSGDKTVLGKITAAGGKIVDGHAPGLSGSDLNAYLSAGMQSDHESVMLEEAREKLRRGMYVMIREGSSEKNLETLLPLLNSETHHRCLLVVDDRTCVDILNDGDIDAVVRKAIRLGVKPVYAIRAATINTATYFRLERLGAIAPGYYANMIVTSNLSSLPIDEVYYRGKLVGRDRKPLFQVATDEKPQIRDAVHIKPFSLQALKLRLKNGVVSSPPVKEPGMSFSKKGMRAIEFPVIEIVPGQIITRKRMETLPVRQGVIQSDIQRDILKLVVVERHRETGNIGIGIVSGFGLKRGALASSIAHDSHNIVCVGTTDSDIYTAVKAVERMHGGLAVVTDGKVIASLPLPVAGLLSDKPLQTVVNNLQKVEKAAANLGCKLSSPFSTLSFVALPVIPELRLTDKGVVDVGEFKLIG